MELKAKVWLEEGGALCFGRGRADLLQAIDGTGSISAAARQMGMSYRHAWTMLKASEQRLGRTLVRRSKGGAGGGGARLTDDARALLRRFHAIEGDFVTLTLEKQHELEALFD